MGTGGCSGSLVHVIISEESSAGFDGSGSALLAPLALAGLSSLVGASRGFGGGPERLCGPLSAASGCAGGYLPDRRRDSWAVVGAFSYCGGLLGLVGAEGSDPPQSLV